MQTSRKKSICYDWLKLLGWLAAWNLTLPICTGKAWHWWWACLLPEYGCIFMSRCSVDNELVCCQSMDVSMSRCGADNELFCCGFQSVEVSMSRRGVDNELVCCQSMEVSMSRCGADNELVCCQSMEVSTSRCGADNQLVCCQSMQISTSRRSVDDELVCCQSMEVFMWTQTSISFAQWTTSLTTRWSSASKQQAAEWAMASSSASLRPPSSRCGWPTTPASMTGCGENTPPSFPTTCPELSPT